MTELKIKQADINNNGNQRLTGNRTGGGAKLKICIMYGSGCTRAGNYLEGSVTFKTLFFCSVLSLVLRLAKHKCDADGSAQFIYSFMIYKRQILV